jgi:putative membrane protein
VLQRLAGRAQTAGGCDAEAPHSEVRAGGQAAAIGSPLVLVFVRLLVLWGINVLALIVVDWMFGGVSIGVWGPLLLGAAVLTLGNAFVKPILALLTLPLIVVTFGLAYFAINVAMLALAEWIAPDFSIDGFWTYVGATIVIWLVNVSVGWLLDRAQRLGA